MRNESKECWGGGTRLEDKFSKASDVNLCDVENFLMCLLKDVTYCRVICDELKWNGEEGRAKVLVVVVRAARGKERELAREGWVKD